jgi:hypothetical protein
VLRLGAMATNYSNVSAGNVPVKLKCGDLRWG